MCFYRSKRFIIAFVCIMLTMVFCFMLVPQSAYAEIGADVKKTMKEFPYYQVTTELTAAELEQYEEHLKSMDFKFAVPSEYIDGVNGTKLDLSKVYISKVNPHETRDAWLSVSVEERVALSQIPEDLLHDMSTDELIITCLNYNLLIDLMLYDSLHEGFEILKKQYNGFSELLSRADAGSRLIALYKAIDYNELYKNDKKAYLRMTLIDLLLTEDRILNSLSDTEVESLVNASYEKAMMLLREGSPVFNYIADLRVGLTCLYANDSSVRKIVNGSKYLKSFVSNTKEL